MALPIEFSLHNLLAFLQYWYENGLSPKVIRNSLPSIHSQCQLYGLPGEAFKHEAIDRFLCSISLNASFAPHQEASLTYIHSTIFPSRVLSCMIHIFTELFFTAFYGLLRMYNIVPHSASKFDPTVHFLRQDLTFPTLSVSSQSSASTLGLAPSFPHQSPLHQCISTPQAGH